jgi:hypothetical protein
LAVDGDWRTVRATVRQDGQTVHAELAGSGAAPVARLAARDLERMLCGRTSAEGSLTPNPSAWRYRRSGPAVALLGAETLAGELPSGVCRPANLEDACVALTGEQIE